MWRSNLNRLIRVYFRERFFLLALVVILFLMGTIFGALAVGVLDPTQKQNLAGFVTESLHGDINLQNGPYTRQTIIANIQTVFFLFFMGISVVGVPLALLLIFTRGFIIGFSICFLSQTMGFKGWILTIAGIIPHNALIIPALLLMVIAMIDCAAALTKIRFTKSNYSIGGELVKSVVLTLIVLAMMIIAGVVQGYLTPLITSWLARVL
ncbi:MAG TPA: stage II sporulation protein M [Bacillota bacterium]|nr:stage II sporulation protein M [Bacillota bacterium]